MYGGEINTIVKQIWSRIFLNYVEKNTVVWLLIAIRTAGILLSDQFRFILEVNSLLDENWFELEWRKDLPLTKKSSRRQMYIND